MREEYGVVLLKTKILNSKVIWGHFFEGFLSSSLFNSLLKRCWVVNVYNGHSKGLRFARQLQDWEVEKADIYFRRLFDHPISRSFEDTVVW